MRLSGGETLMSALAVSGVVLILVILWDTFETMVLPKKGDPQVPADKTLLPKCLGPLVEGRLCCPKGEAAGDLSEFLRTFVSAFTPDHLGDWTHLGICPRQLGFGNTDQDPGGDCWFYRPTSI